MSEEDHEAVLQAVRNRRNIDDNNKISIKPSINTYYRRRLPHKYF